MFIRFINSDHNAVSRFKIFCDKKMQWANIYKYKKKKTWIWFIILIFSDNFAFVQNKFHFFQRYISLEHLRDNMITE